MKNIDINEIVSKVDIVDVISNFSKLIKTGASYKTLCNVHGDKSPSLSINPTKQIYKCFVCDHGGNALDYLIWAQKFSFNQALEYIIEASGEDVSKYVHIIKKKKFNDKELKLLKNLKESSDIFNYYLNIYLETDTEISKFIKSRNLDKEVINKFKLGYAPFIHENNYINLLIKKDNDISTLINSSIIRDEKQNPFYSNQLIFPIFDEDNNVVALSGRKINDLNENLPKYLNSKESLIFKKSEIIYNYNNAKNSEVLIIVEGFMDVIAFSKINYNNAIALMGVAASKNIINKLKKHKEILLFLDNDKAGKIATLKILRELILNNINTYVIDNPYSKDPDEIINDQKLPKNTLSNLLNNKLKPQEFIYITFFKNVPIDDFQKIKEKIIEIALYVKKFDDFFKLDIINRIAKNFNLKNELIAKYFQDKPNMIELNNYSNNNESAINNEENINFIKFPTPLNINKLLISIWQNPSFLKSQNIDHMQWPKAEYQKIFHEIKEYYSSNKKNLSELTINFISKNENDFKNNNLILPKDIESFDELIKRCQKESKKFKINYIDRLFEISNDENYKEELLKLKLELLSKKGKN